MCKKTSGHSSICVPTKPFYINATNSIPVNLESEEQLTIMCSSLNECISWVQYMYFIKFFCMYRSGKQCYIYMSQIQPTTLHEHETANRQLCASTRPV